MLNGEILKAMPFKTISIEGFQLSYLQYKIYESIKEQDLNPEFLIISVNDVHHEKCWAGRSTSWNQDWWEKYQ